MHVPLQVSFHNLDRSEALVAKVQEYAHKLEKYCPNIISCRVVIEALHKHHRHGNHYHVRIDVSVPRGECIASHQPDEHHAYTDILAAVRDGFDAVRRQLEDHVRREKRHTKTHTAALHGRIAELYPDQGYGRIETPDGRLVYFHRNSIMGGDFAKLELGTEVRFDEEVGDSGPQASSLALIGKHHLVP